jgi:hypothetical protein
MWTYMDRQNVHLAARNRHGAKRTSKPAVQVKTCPDTHTGRAHRVKTCFSLSISIQRWNSLFRRTPAQGGQAGANIEIMDHAYVPHVRTYVRPSPPRAFPHVNRIAPSSRRPDMCDPYIGTYVHGRHPSPPLIVTFETLYTSGQFAISKIRFPRFSCLSHNHASACGSKC